MAAQSFMGIVERISVPLSNANPSGVRSPIQDMGTIGDRVRELRGEMTRPELVKAVGAGLTKTTLQTLEEEAQKTSKHLPALAKFFGVSLDWLATGKGPKYPQGEPSGLRVRESYSTRLDPTNIDKAKTIAGFMVESEGLIFDQDGDVDLFVAAYELLADATPEKRARFDATAKARVEKSRGERNVEGHSDAASGAARRGK